VLVLFAVTANYIQNAGFLLAFAEFAVKYWRGRWNTGHLATLFPMHSK